MHLTIEILNRMDPDHVSDQITADKVTSGVNDIETAICLAEKLLEALAGRRTTRRRLDALKTL